MTISDTQKTDFLWKRIIYSVTRTAPDTVGGKDGPNETIPSTVPTYSHNIWSQSDLIPTNSPPVSTSGVVQVYGPTSRLQMTADPTVSGNFTWLACSSFGNTATQLGAWIPPSFHPNYLIQVYSTATGGTSQLAGTSGFEWVFDYFSGTLTFPNGVPAGIVSGPGTCYIQAYLYTGTFGLVGGTTVVGQTKIAYQYSGATVPSGDTTITNFFNGGTPNSSVVSVYYNGIELSYTTEYSVSGSDLVLHLSTLGFSLDSGDIIDSNYLIVG